MIFLVTFFTLHYVCMVVTQNWNCMKKILFSCICLLIFSMLSAQTLNIEVGNGTYGNWYAPFNNYYHYSWNQCIYDAAEIDTSGSITSIAWNCATNQSSILCDDISIYMGTVSSLVTTWLPMSELTLVYHASNITLGSSTGWKTFYLNDPYYYDGTGHLVVVVSKSTNDVSPQRWRYTEVDSTCLYRQSDDNPSFASHPGNASGTLCAERANIRLTINTQPSNCVRPQNVAVSNITHNSVDVTWLNMGNEVTWQATCLPTGNSPYVYLYPEPLTLNTTACSFTGLNPNSTYDVFVRAVCDNNDYSPWTPALTFTTLSENVALTPFFCNFEDPTENAVWVLNPTTATNEWAIGTATYTGAAPGHSLYISNTQGTTYNYDAHTTSSAWAYRDVYFSQALQYVFSFDWKCLGEQSFSTSDDYLEVFIGDPVSIPSNGGIPAGAHPITGQLYQQESWQHFETALDSSYEGVKRLFFHWNNDDWAGEMPAAVDNIRIENTNCGAPSNLVLDSVSVNTATCSWQPFVASDTAWEIYYCQTGTALDTTHTIIINTPYYTMTGLNGSATYDFYVRSACGGSWLSLSFKTDCGPIVNLPVQYGFEQDTLYKLPFCWSILNKVDYLTSYVTNSSAYHGLQYLYIHNEDYVIMPIMDAGIAMNNLQISGWMNGSSGDLVVGVMTDPTDFTTFVPVDTVSVSVPSGTYGFFEVNTANYVGTGRYVSFQPINYSCSIDDIEVMEIPPCVRPIGLTVDSATATAVHLSWTEVGSATSWRVTYGPHNFVPGGANSLTVTVTQPQAVITNLPAGVQYDFYVQADCGANYSPYSSLVSGTVGMIVMPVTGSMSITTCSAIIYDDGGADGNYSSNCNSILVLQPDDSNSVMTLSGTVNLENNYDFIYVYEGVGVLGTLLYTGTSVTTMPTLVSNAGPLTIKFTSDYSMNKPGFVLTAACQPRPSCPPPANIRVIGVESNSVTLTWDAGNAVSWDVYYARENDSNQNTLTVTTDTVTISNLWLNTVYDVYIRAHCGDGEVSELSHVFKARSYTVVMQTVGCAVISTCSAGITDDGGYVNNYSPNCNSELVVYPSTLGALLKLTGNYCIGYGDSLFIYDGAGTGGTLLFHQYGSMSTQQNLPQVISSVGPLTIRFVSEEYVEKRGFEFYAECITCVPVAVTVDSVGSTTAHASWTNAGNLNSEWQVAYGPSGFDINSATPITVTTNSYHMANLAPNMNYQCYVRVVCGSGDYSEWTSTTFHTYANIAQVPYSCDFEDTLENSNWGLEFQSFCPNKWYIGNTANQDLNGTNCLYISSDDGVSNTGNMTYNGVDWAYRDIYFTPAAGYDLSFEWRAEGGNQVYLSVYLGDAVNLNTNYPFTAPSGATTLAAQLNGSSTWQTEHISLNSEWAGTTKRLYFRWVSGNMDAQNPPAAIDAVSISISSCGQPLNVTASNVSNNGAHISWTPAVDVDANWEIVCDLAGVDPDSATAIPVTDTAFDITGLQAMRLYDVYVRTVCGPTDKSIWSELCRFRTDCGEMLLPYLEDFTGYSSGSFPNCWHRIGEIQNPPQIVVNNFGEVSMVASGYENEAYVILPQPESIYASNNLYVEFFVRDLNSNNYIEVGMMTDVNDISTFVPIDTMFGTGSDVFEFGSASFENYTGTGRYITLKLVFTELNFIYIDDVFVNFLHEPVEDTCAVPENLTAGNLMFTRATLTWQQDTSAAHEWEVYYRPVGDNDWSTVVATQPTLLLTGLTDSTTYEAFVVAHCLNGLVSDASDTITFTLPVDSTGVEVFNANRIALYPNPTSNQITISSSQAVIYSVEVYDLAGRQLMSTGEGSISGRVQNDHVTMDVSALPSGVYFSKIETDKGRVVKRFVKR